MKAVQYYTDPGHTLQPKTLTPAMEMGYVLTANIAEKPLPKG